MRALTLTQPWAGLVASGIKLIENRPRKMIAPRDFGKPFAIHASRVIDEPTYDRIYEIAPELNGTYGIAPWSKLSRVTSAVIGVATLDAIAIDRRCGSVGVDDDGHCNRCGLMRIEDDDGDVECPSGFFGAGEQTARYLAPEQRRWFFGLVGYVLRDAIALPTPVPCRGWQGFWTLSDELTDKVSAEVAKVPR